MQLLIIVFVVLLGLLQFTLWFGEGGLPQMWELERKIEAQQAQNQQREERNRALAAEVADLKQGLAAIEERARSEMGMIKADETFFQIIDEQGAGD